MQVFKSGRRSLVNQIRLANPGLSQTSKPITVDTNVLVATNKAVKEALGGKSGLIIALFLKELDRDPDSESTLSLHSRLCNQVTRLMLTIITARGKITLTSKEYGELTSYYTGSNSTTAYQPGNSPRSGVKSRSFFNCLAKGHSIQILGPVEKDLWADVDSVKTEGLISTENAIQFGYAVTLDVFRETLNVQDKRIAADRN